MSNAIEGCSRFLQRLYRLVDAHSERLRDVKSLSYEKFDLSRATPKEKALLRKAHQSLKRITHDFELRWHFNSCVALIMELLNELHAQEPLAENADPAVIKKVFEIMLLMLAPITPHICAELWQQLGNPNGIAKTPWPEYHPTLAAEEEYEIVVQINGKVRAKVVVADGLNENDLRDHVMQDAQVAKLVAGKSLAKVIVVPKRLVNIVLK